MTVKFRYKTPKGDDSQLISHIVYNKIIPFEKVNKDLKFVCAIAQFGMVLRDSKFKGKANYNSIIKLAQSSKGKDVEGYRAEFIKLVKMAELL